MNKLVLAIVTVLTISMSITLYHIAHTKEITHGQIINKQYSVIIEGKTESGKVRKEMIYLNKEQFDYSNIGDCVDLEKVKK